MLTKLKGSGKCGCHAHKRLYEETILVFCGLSEMTRTDRIRYMNTLAEAALLKYGVYEALGVAIDGDDETTGYDLLRVRGRPVATPDLRGLPKRCSGQQAKPPLPIRLEKPDPIPHRRAVGSLSSLGRQPASEAIP